MIDGSFPSSALRFPRHRSVYFVKTKSRKRKIVASVVLEPSRCSLRLLGRHESSKAKNASTCHVVMISGAKHGLILLVCSPIMTHKSAIFKSRNRKLGMAPKITRGARGIYQRSNSDSNKVNFLRRNLSSSNVDYLILQFFKVF